MTGDKERILRGFEHGAELAEDDAANARALAVLAHSLDPSIVRCDHGNYGRGLGEIRGHGSFATGYGVVNVPVGQTSGEVDNSDAT